MSEPYTIRILVPDGDPDGTKIVELLNWTGVGIAFPRSSWSQCRARDEFKDSGVYILIGPAEGTDDDLPTIYVGEGEIQARIDSHDGNKEFWDWGYCFISRGTSLNRAHTAWLEYALLAQAKAANRCHFDNVANPKEPRLSQFDLADTRGFLNEMLRILPVLGVRVFEKAEPVATPGDEIVPTSPTSNDSRDTVIVPAQEPGFSETFLGEHCWYAIRIGGGMLDKIKYIAAYQSSPISAITHFARVDRIEPYGENGKYRLVFAEPAQTFSEPIPFGDAPIGSMQSPRYTSLSALKSATSISELFSS